jgi:hypothetical protein
LLSALLLLLSSCKLQSHLLAVMRMPSTVTSLCVAMGCELRAVLWYNLFTACTLATAADPAAALTISIARAANSIGRVRHAKAGGPFCHEGQIEYAGDAYHCYSSKPPVHRCHVELCCPWMIVHRFIQFLNVSANLQSLSDALMCVICGQVGTACQARRSKQRVPETMQSATAS